MGDHTIGGGLRDRGPGSYMYRLVQASGTAQTWGGGVGWDVNVHVNLRQQLMLRTRGVGGGGGDVNVHVNLRQDVNVHVNLRQQLMLRTRGVGGWGGMLTFM